MPRSEHPPGPLHPSPKVVDHDTQLTLEQFHSAFQDAWSSLRSRFLKVETWQSYQELATNRSQQRFWQGDLAGAQELLREEAEGDRPLYEDIKQRGIDFSRIRLIKESLTDYLRYELLSYQIREAKGETIVVVRVEPDLPLPNADLFDRDTALVHDYGTGEVGAQVGGWLVRDPAMIQELEATTLALRERAVPLAKYLHDCRDRGGLDRR